MLCHWPWSLRQSMFRSIDSYWIASGNEDHRKIRAEDRQCQKENNLGSDDSQVTTLIPWHHQTLRSV